MDLLDAALDLLLGESCVGCARPGRLLCRDCEASLPHRPLRAWPAPAPPGLHEPWAAAPYDATVRAMILGLKEHRLLALVRPLSALLAGAVAAALAALVEAQGVDDPGRTLLVPVPSRAATVRARGHDPTYAVTRAAARRLRGQGLEVRVARALRVRRAVRDQAGLDAEARRANLEGAMRCPPRVARRLRRLAPETVVVCDDVLTTGSTAREALRALRSVGLPADAVAAVAATRRRGGN